MRSRKSPLCAWCTAVLSGCGKIIPSLVMSQSRVLLPQPNSLLLTCRTSFSLSLSHVLITFSKSLCVLAAFSMRVSTFRAILRFSFFLGKAVSGLGSFASWPSSNSSSVSFSYTKVSANASFRSSIRSSFASIAGNHLLKKYLRIFKTVLFYPPGFFPSVRGESVCCGKQITILNKIIRRACHSRGKPSVFRGGIRAYGQTQMTSRDWGKQPWASQKNGGFKASTSNGSITNWVDIWILNKMQTRNRYERIDLCKWAEDSIHRVLSSDNTCAFLIAALSASYDKNSLSFRIVFRRWVMYNLICIGMTSGVFLYPSVSCR